ncbi:MAG: hypothetical protein FWF77_10325 [Defluviitaleaceae bacterium]|nr:hypothetical protein [Defluviitaleaceae bacterium]
MAAISQIVDEQIKQIRKERAELDELRASLERKDDDLSRREIEQSEDTSSERKASLQKEIEDLTAEVKRLRTERDSSIDSFGGEISKVHDEKNAEQAAQVKQYQSEIAFLMKGRADLEDEIEKLRVQLSDMDEKSKKEQARILDEKDSLVSRARDERESSLKEINLAHSVAVAELERKRKELENDVAEMEQNKNIEWNKIQAEISRHKTMQLAELDATREQFLSDLEKEKEKLNAELRVEERKQRSEVAAERREWEREIIKIQAEKQKAMDEIKILEYDQEKMKSEFVIKTEKARLDEEKLAEAKRLEASANLDDELARLTAEYKKEVALEKIHLREQVTALEAEITDAETRKALVLSEITTLDARFEQRRAENENQLEELRLERLKETDEKCVARLAEIESLRQVRIAALEEAYLEKSGAFENARAERLEECARDIKTAEAELALVKQERWGVEKEIENLRLEGIKIKEENDALLKTAVTERRIELEKMQSFKLTEVEGICDARIAAANERTRQIEADGNAAEEKLAADIAESQETLLQLRKMSTAQKLELDRQKSEKLEEIEKAASDALDVYSKMKLTKMSEIEKELEQYRRERLDAIKEDIERQSKAQYKQLDELVTLNEDYNKRMARLNEMKMAVDTEMRTIEFKNKQIAVLSARNKEVELLLAGAKAEEIAEIAELEPEAEAETNEAETNETETNETETEKTETNKIKTDKSETNKSETNEV